MGSSNAIEFSMGFDLAQLQSGAGRAQALVARTMGKISSSSGAAIGVAAGAASLAFQKLEQVVTATVERIRDVWQLGDDMQKLQERTGVTTGRLYMMQRGFKSASVESEKLTPALGRMQVMLGAAAAGSKTASGALDALGLTMGDLQKKSPDQQFITIARAIGKIQDPTARATAAAGMFGKKLGLELMPLFRDSSAIDSMGGKLSEAAQVFEKDSEKFDIANKRVERLKGQFHGFWIGIADKTIDPLMKALAQIQGANFVEKGQQIGAMLVPIINAVGWIASKLKAAGLFLISDFETAFAWGMEGIDSWMTAENRFLNLMKSGFLELSSIAADFVSRLLDFPSNLVTLLDSGLEWAFTHAIAFLNNAFWDVIANVQAGFQFAIQNAISKAISVLPDKLKKFLGVENFKPKSFEELQKEAKQGVEKRKSGPAEDFGSIVERTKKRTDQALSGLSGIRDKFTKWRDSAEAGSQKAAEKAYNQTGDPAIAAVVKQLKDKSFEHYQKAGVAWNQPMAAVEEKKKPEKKKWWEMDGLLAGPGMHLATGSLFDKPAGEGGLSKQARGHVRTAAEAVRYQRERREARQNGQENKNKNQSIEGTNSRLDDLIKLQEEAWT